MGFCLKHMSWGRGGTSHSVVRCPNGWVERENEDCHRLGVAPTSHPAPFCYLFFGIIFLWEPLIHQQMREDPQVHGGMVPIPPPAQGRWQSTTEQKHHKQNNLHLYRWKRKPGYVSLAQESPFSFVLHFFPGCYGMFLDIMWSLGHSLDCTMPMC